MCEREGPGRGEIGAGPQTQVISNMENKKTFELPDIMVTVWAIGTIALYS